MTTPHDEQSWPRETINEWLQAMLSDLAALDAQAVEALLRDVDDHLEAVYPLRERLFLMVDAQRQAEHLADRYLEARDGADPETTTTIDAWPAWRQPLGAHDAYPAGKVRRHGNKLWRSDRAYNAWEPGTSDAGWTDVTAEILGPPPETPTAAPWSKDASYKVGDRVSKDGSVWECRIPHGSEYQGTWAPGVAHSVWVRVEP